MIRRLVGENIEVRLELASDCGLVLVDQTHIEQVLMNLAVNAKDAVSGRGHIVIRTEKRMAPRENSRQDRVGPYVCITVMDDGCGMTEDTQRHIFAPFYTTKDTAHGTGLGLATAYAVVHRYDGFIDVESEPGKGSSFHIFLPCYDQQALVVSESANLPRVLFGSETILLVEDAPNVRRFATAILARRGYQVLAAADGAAALAIAENRQRRIDLLLTDVMMPGMNGPEVAKHLLRSRPELRVLYVSGYADDTVRPEDLSSGGAMFLAKPYSPETLVAKIRELLADTVIADGPADKLIILRVPVSNFETYPSAR